MMETNSVEKLHELSDSFLSALVNFLNEDDIYNDLLNQNWNTGIIIESGKYQLSIDSPEELKLIKEHLESMIHPEVA